MLTHSAVTAVIALLALSLGLSAVARRIEVPYPLLLVVAGIALGLASGLEGRFVDPDLVFLVFLPPILWAAAYFTSWRDFVANRRPIGLLALGLVVATTVVVAVVARAVLPGMPWAAAFALGAIVSPPDAVAATAIAGRLQVPRRIIVVLEGESLVNDASALVLYRAAVAAAVTGTFSLAASAGEFLLAALLGVGMGLATGVLLRHAVRFAQDPFIETALTLLGPYIAWTAAEAVHASGVLACVAGGLYVRRHFSTLTSPSTRLAARAVWDVFVFVLNALIFLLIGLQVASLRGEPDSALRSEVMQAAVAVSVAVIAVRLAWVPVASWLPRALVPAIRARDPLPGWKTMFLVGWTGMRGVVSLASALALPLTVDGGAPFPYRDEILVCTVGVVLATLLLQGVSLAPIIRALRLPPDDLHAREEAAARRQLTDAALERLEALVSAERLAGPAVDRTRARYERRARQFGAPDWAAEHSTPEQVLLEKRLRYETLMAERLEAIRLRNSGVIGEEVLFHLERELDVEAVRSGLGELRPAPLS